MQTHDINRKNLIFQELDYLIDDKICIQGDVGKLLSFIHNSDIIVKDIWTETGSSKRMKGLDVPAFQIDILFHPNDEIAVYCDTTNPYFTKQRMGFQLLERFISQFSFVVFNFRFSEFIEVERKPILRYLFQSILGYNTAAIENKQSVREAELVINEVSLTHLIDYALEHNDKELFQRATSDLNVLGLTYRG